MSERTNEQTDKRVAPYLHMTGFLVVQVELENHENDSFLLERGGGKCMEMDQLR